MRLNPIFGIPNIFRLGFRRDLPGLCAADAMILCSACKQPVKTFKAWFEEACVGGTQGPPEYGGHPLTADQWTILPFAKELEQETEELYPTT